MSFAAINPATAAPARRFRQQLLRLTVLRALLLLVADTLALVGATLLAALVPATVNAELAGSYGTLLANSGQTRVSLVLGFGALLMIWFYSRGHYSLRLPFWIENWHLVAGCTFALLGDGFLQFALKQDFSRLWLVNSWGFAVPALIGGRFLARKALRRLGVWEVPTLIVGNPERLDEAMALMAEPTLGYSVAAVRSLGVMADRQSRSWTEECLACGAQMVILAANEEELQSHRALVSRLGLERIPFICVRSLGGLPVISVDAHHIVGRETLLLVGQSQLLHPLGRAVKNVSDYAAALLILVLALPLLMIMAALVALDGGPIFYRHTRVGARGRVFQCLKFRTMVPHADRVLEGILAADPDRSLEWAENQKLQNDPRITWIGRFARAFSLDELPQLFNVLRGDMSLVGPRPIHPNETERFGLDIDFYYQVKPGITGLWQVSGRNDLPYARRVELNNWYVKNWSLWLDVVILLKTIPTVLGRRGAY